MDNGYLTLVPLSDIELYYTPKENIEGNVISVFGEEFRHAVKVMRNKMGDIIYITSGTGSIFKSEISTIEYEKLTAKIIDEIVNRNDLENIFFCISKLKNPERFKFALEKCVELGVINFIIFESERTISKGSNIKRWERIALAAMKQSIRSHLPQIGLVNSLKEIKNFLGEKIVFDQNAKQQFKFNYDSKKKYYFIFGPEGGLSENELNLFKADELFSISKNRLRSETAIVKVASSLI